MEHRWTPRFPWSLAVSLRMRGCPVGDGQSVDVCDLGMFIELADDPCRLAPGQAVEVVLRDAPNSSAWAVVVHRRDSGIGVMFARRDPFEIIDTPASACPPGIVGSHAS